MADEERKQGHGCFFYGCLTLIILALIVVGVVVYGLWRAREYAFQYTDTKPAEFPAIKNAPEVYDKTVKKLNDFATTLQTGKQSATLKLTADEMNILINQHQDFAALKGKLYVTFKDNKATGQVSIPLDKLSPLWLGKGRYLNGSATLDISAKDGLLFMYLTSLEVKGKQIPAVIMDQIRRANLAENANRNPQDAAKLKRIKNLTIQEDTLIVEMIPGS
jgi:hypothetical protein